jgi:hypothetical protein
MKPSLLAAALLAALCAPAWALNKCTAPDGKVQYQNGDCSPGSKSLPIPSACCSPTNTDAGLGLDERIKRAAAKCGVDKLPEYPSIGWAEERFLSCSVVALTQTPLINTTETAFGTSKQYVFRYYKAYIYVRDGKVTTIQR